MSHRDSHPPKPVLAYRLGVAGTRDLTDAAPGLADRIDQFLAFLAQQVHAIWKDNLEYFDEHHNPRLILICSLAKGIDLLVARLGAKRGFEIHAPLAFDHETYEARNFGKGDEADRHTFQEFMLNPDVRKLELDGDPNRPDSDAYEAAARVLINNCDALLAVWNLSKGNGPGGTADTFDKALPRGLVVLRMNVEKEEGPFWHENGADRSYVEIDGAIRAQLLSGITIADPLKKADPQAVNRVRREQQRLRRYYQEKEWRLDFGWPYRIANRILSFGQRDRKKSPAASRSSLWRLVPYRRRVDDAWCPAEGVPFEDPARHHFMPFDQWADGLAVFYANCMRSTVAVTLLIGALLLAYSLAEKLWPRLGRDYGFPLEEGLAALLLTLLVIVGRWRQVHSRWLQYRMLSEFLRGAALASAIGGLPIHQFRFREDSTVDDSWVSFYFEACVRNMGLPNVRMTDLYLAGFRSLLTDRLAGQIDFHRDRQLHYGTIDRNIRACGIFVFSVSILGALLEIAHTLAPAQIDGLIGDRWPRHFSNAAQILPIFGGALAALVSQESFGRLAHLSASIVRRLAGVAEQVKTASLKSTALREQTALAIDEMMAEHEEWFTLISLREIEFPH